LHATHAGEQFGYLDGMIDVRRRFDVLTTLVSMLIGSEMQGFKQVRDAVTIFHIRYPR
jgi:hypothetical protein